MRKKPKKSGLLKSIALSAGMLIGCGNSNPYSPIQQPVEKETVSERSNENFFNKLSPEEKIQAQNIVSSWGEIPENLDIKRSTKSTSQNTRTLANRTNEEQFYWVDSIEDWETSPDFNKDRKVNFTDFLLFGKAFNTNNPKYDIDGDGRVYFSDFIHFVQAFGKKVNSDLAEKPSSTINIPQLEPVVNYHNDLNSENPEDKPYSIDLSDLVENIVFPEDPIEFSVRNTEGIVYRLEKNEEGKNSLIVYRPKGTFNFKDNGTANIEFQARKDGSVLTKNIPINIKKNDRAVLMYEQTTSSRDPLWKTTPKIKIFKYVMDDEDSIDPTTWSGGEIPPHYETWINQIVDEFHTTFPDYFAEKPTVEVTDVPDFYHPNTKPRHKPQRGDLIVYLEEKSFTSATINKNQNEIYGSMVTMPPTENYAITLHEIVGHALTGMDHANPLKFDRDETLFNNRTTRTTLSDLDKFVINARKDYD